MLKPLSNEIQEHFINVVVRELNKNYETSNLSYQYEYHDGLHRFVLLDGTIAVSHVEFTWEDLWNQVINDMLECAKGYLIHIGV